MSFASRISTKMKKIFFRKSKENINFYKKIKKVLTDLIKFPTEHAKLIVNKIANKKII